MKIGLIKFCSTVSLDVLNSTSNDGSDDRFGFLRELINRGHEITIFSPMIKGTRNNPKEERWITGDDIESIPKELHFIKQIGYAPGELPIGKFKVDVLLADAGVGSMAFPNNYHEEPGSPEGSLIRRFVHVLNAHKGPVFYLHNDPSLPFYFRQLAGRKYPWGHKNNGYTNPIKENRGEKWVRDSGWADHDEIFKDKTSIVLTRCLPSKFEYMIDNFNVDRAGYKEFSNLLNFEYVPPAYAYDLAKEYNHVENIEYPLFYSGGDRRRRISFRKFYEEMGVPTFVSGKWAEEAMVTFDGINFMGWLENRRALLDGLNKSGAVVQIQPKDAAHMGWWTARTMEAAACRTMGFIDGSITSASDLVFDKWFVLNNKTEARHKLYAFLSMPLKDRIKLIDTQLSYCKTMFTWQRFTDVFMSICNKYIDRKVVNEVRDSYRDSITSLLNTGYAVPEYISSERLEEPAVDIEAFFKKMEPEVEEVKVEEIPVTALNPIRYGCDLSNAMRDMVEGQTIENATYQDIPASVMPKELLPFHDIPADLLKVMKP